MLGVSQSSGQGLRARAEPEPRHRANPQELQPGRRNWGETDNPRQGFQQEFHIPGSVNIKQPNSCSCAGGQHWDADLSLTDPDFPSQRKSVFPANPIPVLHQKQPDPEERIFKVQNPRWKNVIEQSELPNQF